jgi:hypothetical protein
MNGTGPADSPRPSRRRNQEGAWPALVIVQNLQRKQQLFADMLHYLPTCSTICRHAPLFADAGNYLPSQAIIRRQKGRFFADTFLTRLRLHPSETFHFPFWAPPSPPTFGAASRSASPAARPRFLPARQPARILEWYTICRQKVHYLPTLYTICRQKVHYLPTLYSFCRQRFIICRHSILFADKGLSFADTVYTIYTVYDMVYNCQILFPDISDKMVCQLHTK